MRFISWVSVLATLLGIVLFLVCVFNTVFTPVEFQHWAQITEFVLMCGIALGVVDLISREK